MRLRSLPVAVLVVAVSACDGAPASDTGETTTAPVGQSSIITTSSNPSSPTTSTPSTTTAPVESTTTLVMPTTTVPVRYTIAEHGMWPPSLIDDPSIYGSGCSPKSDVLPDGIWFGFVRDIDATTITFDLACLAVTEVPDGQENAPWSIINGNDRVRSVPVAESALVACELADCDRGEIARADNMPEVLEYVEWITHVAEFLETWPQATEWSRGGGVGVLVWLYINDGLVTEALEPVLAG